MKTERFIIRLFSGQGEVLESPAYQKALHDLEDSLRANDLKASFQLDRLYAGAGESAAILSGAILILGAISPAVRSCVVEWIKARSGRKVRLEIGQNGRVRAEAQTVEQVEKLFGTAQKYQNSSAKSAQRKKPATAGSKRKRRHE